MSEQNAAEEFLDECREVDRRFEHFESDMEKIGAMAAHIVSLEEKVEIYEQLAVDLKELRESQ